MENGPFEDVFPIENGDIPAIAMLVYQRVIAPFPFVTQKTQTLMTCSKISWQLAQLHSMPGSQTWRHCGFFSAGDWGKVPICF